MAMREANPISPEQGLMNFEYTRRAKRPTFWKLYGVGALFRRLRGILLQMKHLEMESHSNSWEPHIQILIALRSSLTRPHTVPA